MQIARYCLVPGISVTVQKWRSLQTWATVAAAKVTQLRDFFQGKENKPDMPDTQQKEPLL